MFYLQRNLENENNLKRQSKSTILHFFKYFETTVRNIAEEDKNRVRKAYGWNGNENLINTELANEKINVFVR